MKRLVLSLGIIVAASCITWALKAQDKPKQSLKTYNVTLTREQWAVVLNGLELVKNAVKTSNMTAAQSTFICDSVLSVYQLEFDRQVTTQLAAEQKLKDSTNKKK